MTNVVLSQGIEATDIGSLLEQFLEYEKGEYYKTYLFKNVTLACFVF